MISLDVEDYCDDCPDFEADIDKTTHSFFDGNGDVETTNTIISCKHKKRCEKIRKYLEEKRLKEGNKQFVEGSA